MSFTIRMVSAVACAFLGLMTSSHALWHAHYWSAAGLFIGALMFGATFLLGFDSVQNTVPGFLGATLFAASGWAAVVTESPGFDPEGQTVEIEVAMDVLSANARSRWNWKSPELQRAAEQAGKLCMLQGGALDQMDATLAGAKTIYYGPGATLADASIDLIESKPDAPDCLVMFRQLYAADPGVFRDITSEHKTWLRAHNVGT